LSQCFRAPLQKGDGVTIAQDFNTVFVGPFTHCFSDFCNTGFPILCPGTNGALYSRPVFFLVRCQLQRGLYQINPSAYSGPLHLTFPESQKKFARFARWQSGMQ
jgi:hypothetical protein